MGSLLVLCSKTETGKNFLGGNFFTVGKALQVRKMLTICC